MISFTQVDRSGLSSTVTGRSGRVQPEVHIVAVENLTSLSCKAVSDTSGNYSIPQLPVGIYSVTAHVPRAIHTGGSNQRTIRFAGRGLDDSDFKHDGVDAGSIVNQTQGELGRLVGGLIVRNKTFFLAGFRNLQAEFGLSGKWRRAQRTAQSDGFRHLACVCNPPGVSGSRSEESPDALGARR